MGESGSIGIKSRTAGALVSTARLGLTVIAAAVALATAPTSAVYAAECRSSSEAVRSQQHATYLPDCRAYELVSPVGAIPTESGTGVRASAAEEGSYAGAIAWMSAYPYPMATANGLYFLSKREAGGWSTSSTTPDHVGDAELIECKPFIFYSATLDAGVVSANRETDGVPRSEEEYCAHTEPWPLVAGEPEGVQNLFLRDDATDAYSLLNVTPEGVPPAIATLQDATPDLTSVVFSEDAPLTAGAPEGEDLYETSHDGVTLVSILPEGRPVAGTIANATRHTPERNTTLSSGPVPGATEGAAPFTNAMSTDGSRVVFEAEGKLYLRINVGRAQSALAPGKASAVNGEQCEEAGAACTVQVDASTASGSGGGGTFLWANESDTKIFFMADASKRLTNDTVANSGENLYEYALASGQSSGALVDVTPGGRAEVVGVSGFGERTGHAVLYFVARGDLGGEHRAENAPVPGEANLYAFTEGGTTRFIATLAPGDTDDWAGSGEEFQHLGSEAAPDGAFFTFRTTRQLGAYENADAVTGRADEELYLYEVATGDVQCASCDQSRARPRGSVGFVPAAVSSGRADSPGYLRREVLNDGRVFFESPDELVTADKNGEMDVYEYDAGEVSLISGGASQYPSEFIEATPEGRNVFFFTSQALVAGDTDHATSLYDAREGGGFLEGPAPPGACNSTAECQAGSGPAAVVDVPSSVSFVGSGNQKSPSSKTSKAHGRRARDLRRALTACKRRHRDAGRKLRECKRRARKRYGAGAAKSWSSAHSQSHSGRKNAYVDSHRGA